MMPLRRKPLPARLPCDAPLQLWTVMSALRLTAQRLAAVKAALVDVAAMWSEVAPSCSDTVDRLIGELDELHRDIGEAVGEKMTTGEEDGL